MAWLEATLKNSTADFLWLAGHYPIYAPCLERRVRDSYGYSEQPRVNSSFVSMRVGADAAVIS